MISISIFEESRKSPLACNATGTLFFEDLQEFKQFQEMNSITKEEKDEEKHQVQISDVKNKKDEFEIEPPSKKPKFETSSLTEWKEIKDGMNNSSDPMSNSPFDLEEIRKKLIQKKCTTFISHIKNSTLRSDVMISSLEQEGWGMKILRGDSLEFDLNYGVAVYQGSRGSMEDFHFIQPFPSMRELYEKEKDKENVNTTKEDTIDNSFHSKSSSCNTNNNTNDTSNNNNTSNNDNVNDNSKKTRFDNSYAFFAVMDGHGGTFVALYVKDHLHDNIVNHPCFFTDTKKAILEGFQKTETSLQEYAKQKGVDIGGIGSTATVAILIGNLLYVANLGDTEAVLSIEGTTLVMTTLHTLANPTEKERLEQIGAEILANKDPKKNRVGHPVWNKHLINIALTRTFGDIYFKDSRFTQGKPSGLITEPSIQDDIVTKKDDFLIIASDGFWEVVTYEEAVRWVKRFQGEMKINNICKTLTDLAKSRNASDNTTVLIVSFK